MPVAFSKARKTAAANSEPGPASPYLPHNIQWVALRSREFRNCPKNRAVAGFSVLATDYVPSGVDN